MSRPSRLTVLTFILLAAAGCDVLRAAAPLVLPQAPTPRPTHTPYPTPTPQPGATVTFKIHAPVNTPSGSSVVMIFPDFVGGLANKTFILSAAGGSVWTANVSAPIGSLLHYRFQRTTGPQIFPEVHADGGAVAYRTALVTGPLTVADSIAAWSDTPFVGEKGRITGIVRDASSNQGLPGVIVSAGGQQTLTNFDGEYSIWNLPTGAPTPVTAFAPDGSFRAVMGSAAPRADEAVHLDLSMWAAKTVKVTFIVAPPSEMAPGPPIRLAGSVLQLGHTFAPGAFGGSTAASREAVLAPLADGRWGTTVDLFEGTDLRYKYTLGSGYLNAELAADGSAVLRQLVLPGDDEIVVQDQIAAWHVSIDQPVSFVANVPPTTPPTEAVTLQFNLGGGWLGPVPMWQTGPTTWNYLLYNPLDFYAQAEYRFCRNYQCGTADDSTTFGASPAGYRFTPTVLPQALQNSVAAWQWWDESAAPAAAVPPIAARQEFQAGFELAPWAAADQPFLANALDSIRADSANWVRIDVVWDAPSANPPLISFDFKRSLLRSDLIEAIRSARARGFKVALYPQVRPAPDGPFGGDLNAYFNAGARDTGWWEGWFREYARFLAYQADVAAFTGADMLYVGDSSLARALPGGEAPDADQRWRSIIAALRKDHYNAPMAFALHLGGQSPALTAPPTFLDAVDVIDVRLSAALSPLANASLSEMKSGAASVLDGLVMPLHAQFNKPIILTAVYPSADGGAAACIGRAGGGCQPPDRVAPDQPDTPLYPLDLNEQAAAYEALLHATIERPWISGFYGYGYSVPVALRDKYFSPHAKPVESLLASWFPRMK